MEKIVVNVISTWEHCSQRITGYKMLEGNSMKTKKKEGGDTVINQ